MTRWMYTLALRLLALPIWAAMSWGAWRSGTAWHVFASTRFGLRDPNATVFKTPPVWVHAVSVGETRAAEPLIRALLARGDCVLLTHMTPTGRETGSTLYAKAIAEGRLQQTWMPYDFPGACRRFVAQHAPRLGILIEREVWPNMVAVCVQLGMPLALVSARLSERGQRRSYRLGPVLREAYASLTVVCAQSHEDAARLTQLGVGAPMVCGNLKFDVVLDAEQLARGRAWRQALGRPVIMFASTREGEDRPLVQAVLGVLEQRAGDLAATHAHVASLPTPPLFLWVPRHAQRFDEVAATASQSGLAVVRRAQTGDALPSSQAQVYLGDTLGDMAFYYGASNVAVMGGSFAPLGSQNFIEACAAGVPVILGPSIYNFQDAARDALASGLVTQVSDAQQALVQAVSMAEDSAAQAAFADRAAAWMHQHVGATERILARLP